MPRENRIYTITEVAEIIGITPSAAVIIARKIGVHPIGRYYHLRSYHIDMMISYRRRRMPTNTPKRVPTPQEVELESPYLPTPT